MTVKAKSPEETYGPALKRAIGDLARVEPPVAAAHAGVQAQQIEGGRARFAIPFFNAAYHVYWPDGLVEDEASSGQVDIATRIILLHYLLTADGAPMADRWIAFRSLPGGLGYDGAFQGRASLRLARAFGADRSGFAAVCVALGGERLSFGDASFGFRVLPRLWLAAVLNLADDEFPANANVLFDAAASHYLPTEDLAVLGGFLASRLIRESRVR